MNSSRPVEKLSKPVTVWPCASSRSTRLEPINPAAPVTKARKHRSQMRSRPLCVGGAGAHGDGVPCLRGAIGPDLEHVDHISDISTKQLQTAVPVIAPANGHFFHRVSHFFRQG